MINLVDINEDIRNIQHQIKRLNSDIRDIAITRNKRLEEINQDIVKNKSKYIADLLSGECVNIVIINYSIYDFEIVCDGMLSSTATIQGHHIKDIRLVSANYNSI